MLFPGRRSPVRSLSLRIARYGARVDNDRSLALACRLARLEPGLGWVRFYRAGLLLFKGRLKEALSDLSALETISPDMMFAGGREFELPAAAAEARLDGAMRRLMHAAPKSAWVFVLESYRRRMRSQWKLSRQAMSSALRLSPRNPTLWGLAARIGYVSRLAKGSVSAMEKARRLAPECFWINAWAGEVRRYLGDWRAAQRLLDAALKSNPNYFIAYSWRGGARRMLGNPRGALADLDLAIAEEFIEEEDKASLAWAYHERSLVKRDLRDFAGAFRDLNKAHKLNGRYVWASRDNRGGQPRYDQSLALLTKVLSRQPRSAWALAWRGYSHGITGNTAQAREDLARALTLKPGLAWAHAWKAGVELDAGRREPALDALKCSLALDPNYALSRLLRGKYLNAQGFFREAEKELADSLRQDPFCASAWLERSRAARGLKRAADAAEFSRRAFDLDPRAASA